mgnify:CR=1 FL=1
MKKIISSLVAIAAISSAVPAFAHSVQIRCKSVGYKFAACGAGLSYVHHVQLLRQRSHSACIAGSTFGVLRHRNGMWVSDGCEGDFLVHGR